MNQNYPTLRRIGKLLYEAWENRPDTPIWVKGTPWALAYDAADSIVDIQVQAAKKISEGKVAGKNQYNDIERDRVESPTGFKPIWSPGGFQV